MHECDALVVGGGFYGVVVACYLARRRALRRVVLVERERDLLQRASCRNQARVHNGYHYPRSFTTAYRSRVNLPRFLRDYPEAVRRDFTQVYAIARKSSKVTATQFARFCRQIGASLEPVGVEVEALFDARLIENVFSVEEFAFDAAALREHAWGELRAAGVETLLEARVTTLERAGMRVRATGVRAGHGGFELDARHAFNCTYSGLNAIGGGFPGTSARLKHEITEIALVTPPAPLARLGVTVMDGSFFSLMPFPGRGLHSLSHVRYTPHRSFGDAPGSDPYGSLEAYDQASRVDRMVRDASRYLPCMRDVEYRESLFEVKTVLAKNESDDGRPILFETHEDLGSCHSILGGKIDNVYDVLDRLDQLPLD